MRAAWILLKSAARDAAARFRHDERGNIAIISALFLTTVMGFAALGVDVGKVFSDRRKAQGAVDLAAIAAVSDLAHADKAANATIASNGYPPGTSVLVELGIYTADPTVAPAARFQTSSAATANAARVTLQNDTELVFGKALLQTDHFTIKTKAVATQSAFAEFAIGSRLASLNGGLLNAVLGGMLGTSLSLSAMDYQSLLDARIDLFDLMNNAAAAARLSGPTYSSILGSNVRVGTLSGALLTTAQADGVSSSALSALHQVASAVSGVADPVGLGRLLDVGPYDSLPLGQKPKTAVSVSALDLISAMAQIANGPHQVAANVNLGIPGIASAALQLSVGERPVGTSWVTVGAAGAQVHTAQTRILLTLQLGGSGSIASVSVPLYVEVASGTAVLKAVSCGFPDVGTSTVSLGVTPGVIDAWIGGVSSAQLDNFSAPPNPPPATLVNAAGISVTGRAHVAITNMSAQSVTFSYADIAAQTRKTVSTQSYTSSLTASLLGDLRLNASVLGLGIGLPALVTGQVAGILSTATTPIDQALASVLSTLGVGIGQADVWVPGIRCDGAVLVN